MLNPSHLLIKKYFDEQSFIQSDIESFNTFINEELKNIIKENKNIEPTIIPPSVDDFKIKIDRIWVEKPDSSTEAKGPTITEADGSKRKIYPTEARLRKISYASPCYIDISAHVNGLLVTCNHMIYQTI